MSPARRLLLGGLALVVAVAVAVAAGVALLREAPAAVAAVPQDRPGPVLLVPGYGGNLVGLRVLAEALEAAGRQVELVPAVGDGTGDLEDAVLPLRAAADRLLAEGAPSVDVVGYSAGGVTARLWAELGGAAQARRVVTLGSPHHGTQVAALGAVFASGACPSACQQLVPGSPLLRRLNAGDETPDGPRWLTVRTADDTVVTPVDSAVLGDAVNVLVQDVCPGARVDHGQLPRDPRVQAMVLSALSPEPLAPPPPSVCAASGS